MTTAALADVSHLRVQLKMLNTQSEKAFERAFDLRQAGASETQVDAAMAEMSRLQERIRGLREQLGEQPALH